MPGKISFLKNMADIYVALGSNKGDRRRSIIKALGLIQEQVFITRISSFIETPPEEGVSGGYFLNGALKGKTPLSPGDAFDFLQEIERKMGRCHPHQPGEERSIDLDLIFYGQTVIKTDRLVLPHPRYRERYFVLIPLREIGGIKDI